MRSFSPRRTLDPASRCGMLRLVHGSVVDDSVGDESAMVLGALWAHTAAGGST